MQKYLDEYLLCQILDLLLIHRIGSKAGHDVGHIAQVDLDELVWSN